MEFDDAQKQRIAGWLDEGFKLAEVQTRIQQEFGRNLTYSEVKMLASELDLLPRDPELPAAPDKDPPSSTAPPAQLFTNFQPVGSWKSLKTGCSCWLRS